MAVEIDTVYAGQLRCDATHGPSGMKLHTDAPVDNGGQGKSFSPTDLVATALGTCVMTILGLVAQRHGIDLRGTKVHVTKEMVSAPVRRIASLRTVVTVPSGVVEDDSMRERMEAAARKCPVHQSLHPEIDAPIEFICVMGWLPFRCHEVWLGVGPFATVRWVGQRVSGLRRGPVA